jgi:hypothetical protein
MWAGCSLDSRFAVKFRIFHFPHNSYIVCWLPQLFMVTLERVREEHLGSELVKHGIDQCAISRVISWAEVSTDWYYTHYTSLLLAE